MDKYDKAKIYSNKYRNFEWILYEFLEDTYLDSDKRDDIKTIQRFCRNRRIAVLKSAIHEGKEVLKLEPFPWEWVADVCNYFPFNDPKNDSESGYKKWIKWIIDEIENEVKDMHTKNPHENEENNREETGSEE